MFDNNVPQNLPIKDDLPEKLNPSLNTTTPPKKPEVEDLPKPQQMPASPPSANLKEAEDIFSGVKDAAPKPVNFNNSVSSSPKPTDENMLPSGTEMSTPHQSFKKVLITIIGILVVSAILVAVGYWVYKSFINSTPEPAFLQPEVTTPTAVTPPVNNTPPVVNNPVPTIEDKDNDGLSDQEELLLGTNPLAPDTDGDLLFDREEVEVYKTDPLNPDTDGDGYNDGAEVQNGFDPRGPGKLLKVENPVSTSTQQ